MRRFARTDVFALLGWGLLATLPVYAGSGDQSDPGEPTTPAWTEEQLSFFETRIRPVLIQHCYECHSAEAKSVKGGLLVDSRDGILTGGDSGPALVPKNVQESLLISALKHESFEMPPKGKLPAKVIADFAAWIEMGAPDPRTQSPPKSQRQTIDLEAGRRFWSFQPLRVDAPPAVKNADWARHDIDRFVLSRMEAAGWTPSPPTDRLTLLRRLSFDLIGLPPSLEEQWEFAENESDAAVEKVIDRLLNSPRFGERWGRYWLDSARFSESTGGGRSMIYGPAWRYRDYVIDAFNQDKPYDTFIIEQLAGDLLSSDNPQERAAQITATGFLALGPSNLELQDKKQLDMDIADEQIDTVGRVFLAMTLGCARCHDHKFDPVPTADYYALAGIFRSTHTVTHSNVSNWVMLPLPLEPQAEAAYSACEARIKQLDQQLTSLNERSKELRRLLPEVVLDDDQAKFTGAWGASTHTKGFVGAGYRTASGAGNQAIFSLPVKPGVHEVLVSYTPGSNRAKNAKVLIADVNRQHEVIVDQTLTPPEGGQFISLGDYTFGDLATVVLTTDGVDGVLIVDAVKLRSRLTTTPAGDANDQAAQDLAALSQEITELTRQRDELVKSLPPRDQALAVQEAQEVRDEQICIRGNIKQRGEKVPRGFLSVASFDGQPQIAESSSGRLELGYWMADPRNPLTARVYVNRVWSRLFGQGLVRTVDNFGTPGERPSHPELLDYLADRFIREGWSTKRLIRNIVLSRTYQQSSSTRPEIQLVDPDNRLLTRQNCRRLDAEAIHDALLFVAGELELEQGGDTIAPNTKSEYGYEFQAGRRAVYLPVFRNQLPDTLSVFDFANPNQSVGQRTTSTLSTQALFLMNSPFVIENSRSTADRVRQLRDDDAERIEVLFELALGRPPTSTERELALAHLRPADADSADARQRWQELCQSVFGSIAFRFLR